MPKVKCLAVYDYGQGGIWMFVLARSQEEVEVKYPELKVVTEHPDWLTGDRLRRLEETSTYDIDQAPQGWLKSLVEGRQL